MEMACYIETAENFIFADFGIIEEFVFLLRSLNELSNPILPHPDIGNDKSEHRPPSN